MDTKPKYLAIFSKGWDASTPLTYTLQRNAKYAHFGYTKTFGHIKTLFSDPATQKERHDARYEMSYQHILAGTWENFLSNTGHKMNLTSDLEPIRDFPLDHLKELISFPYTTDKYIKFYLKLYNHIKQKGYQSVADFISLRTEPALNSDLYPKLKENFDVKCIFLVRDPIRQSISKALSEERFTTFDTRKIILKPDPNIFYKYLIEDGNDIESWDFAKSIFPNIHMVVMEELWEDNGETRKKLSEFLEHPIDDLWPNLYAPDIGHRLVWDTERYYCPTPCQPVGQSSFHIKPEYYMEMRTKYSFLYDNWIERFGSLPLHWGEHIDYDKNLEIYPHFSHKRRL